ncbi:MAG TPA: hypothetical protein VLB44_25335 [Kofleriaceae bacterium]|nr:hypothetical protein [Kofleriaceae bacterium]
MRRVLLIVVVTGCWGKPPMTQPAPAAPLPAVAASAPAEPAETVWDQGTFVTVTRGQPLPDYEETFVIHRTADGYRFDVQWKRPALSGARNDGHVTMTTDAHFTPIAGEMISVDHEPKGDATTRSTITRDPDGLLTTEVVAPDGQKQVNHATERSDWFIGGTITTFLVALCQADPSVTAPIAYPGKRTTLGSPEPVRVEGADRHVVLRALEYVDSHRQVNAACEDGKIMGEHSSGYIVVRKGDLALATALGAGRP